jgi:hypothetical protein
MYVPSSCRELLFKENGAIRDRLTIFRRHSGNRVDFFQQFGPVFARKAEIQSHFT